MGAVATQNVTDPTLGPKTLDLLALGLPAEQTLDALRRSSAFMEYPSAAPSYGVPSDL